MSQTSVSKRSARATAGSKPGSQAAPATANETQVENGVKHSQLTIVAPVPATATSTPQDDDFEQHAYAVELKEASFLKIDGALTEDGGICDAIRAVISGDPREIGRKASSASLRVSLIGLRSINRLLQLRLKSSRDAVAAARQSAENKHLALENLLYEVGHLERQIATCRSFRSRADNIPLVSVEEFYSSAPTSISRPAETRTNDHEQFKARLAWELEQRKLLAERLKTIEMEIDSLNTQITCKKALLEAIRPRLKSVIEASGGLDDVLKSDGVLLASLAPLSRQARRTQMDMAARLPKTMHAVYIKLHALLEVRGAELGLTAIDIVPTNTHSSIVNSSDKPIPHELSVVAAISNSSAVLKVVISCFPELDELLVAEGKLSVGNGNSSPMVSVKIAPVFDNPYLLLNNVIPSSRCHKSSAAYISPAVRRRLPASISPSVMSMLNLAYPWLHTCAGVLPFTVDPRDQETFLNSVVSADRLVVALNGRITSRLALYNVLVELESGQLPSLPPTPSFANSNYSQLFNYPSNLATNVRLFDFNLIGVLDGTKTVADLAAANHIDISSGFNKSDSVKAVVTSLEERGFYFRFKLEKAKMVLVADVVVPADYPVRWPLFSLSVQGSLGQSKVELSHLLEQAESYVNIDVGKKLLMATSSANSPSQIEILSALFHIQTCQLASCWEAIATGGAVPNRQQQQSHHRRGRDRSRAWQYDPTKGDYAFVEDDSLSLYGCLTAGVATTLWNDLAGDSDSEDSADDNASERREDCRRLDERRSQQRIDEEMAEGWPS